MINKVNKKETNTQPLKSNIESINNKHNAQSITPKHNQNQLPSQLDLKLST